MRIAPFVRLSLLAAALVISPKAKSSDNEPVIEDFSQIDFQNSKPKALNVPWSIYWGQLIEPGSPIPAKADGTLSSPRSFKDLPDIKVPGYAFNPREGLGAATFIKLIRGLPASPRGYDLSLLAASTSYRLCVYPIDQPQLRQCEQSGQPGLSRETTIPQVSARIVTFYPQSADQVWVLNIAVANFHSFTGGLRYGAPELSIGGIGRTMREKTQLHEFLALGFLLAIMAYSFMIWARRREDLASLGLAALCLVTGMRLLFASHLIHKYVDSSTAFFQFKYAIEYSTLLLMPLAYLWFIQHAFSPAAFPRVFRVIAMSSIPFLISILLLDSSTYTKYLMIYQIYVLTSIAYGLTVLFRSWRMKIEGAVPANLGAIVVVFTSVWDILIARNILPHPFISQFGIAFFMFLQGQVVAGRFARAFRTAEKLSRSLQEEVDRQTAEIKEKTSEIRSVMENIPEGIVYVTSPEGQLSEVRSNYLQEIFTHTKSNSSIDELLSSTNLNVDERANAVSIVTASIGQDSLTWEANAAQLPRSIMIQTLQTAPGRSTPTARILELDWHPVVSEDGTTSKILLSAHDVTALREMERQAREKSAEAQRLNEVIGNKQQLLRRFFMTTKDLIETIQKAYRLIKSEELDAKRSAELLSTLYGSLHTVKGMARTLKLSELASAVHSAENPLFQLLRGDARAEKDQIKWLDSQDFHNKLGAAIDSYKTYRGIYDGIAREWGQDTHQHSQSVSARQFTRELLEAELPLARELGKLPPHIEIQGSDPHLSDRLTSILQQAFVHLTRNSLDHGLETAEERVLAGKAPSGTISINIEELRPSPDLSVFRFTFTDDGRGLNLDKLKSKCRELKLLSEIELNDPELIATSIFREGFSSKSEVSEVSGRGIGMGEVKRVLELAGGSIELKPLKHSNWKAAAQNGPGPHPFTLILTMPGNESEPMAVAS